MNTIKRIFLFLSLIIMSSNLTANMKMKETLLKVNGIGDFALHSISSQIVGSAYMQNEKFPDIFVIGDKWYPSFFRYRYVEHNKAGVPVFEQVGSVKLPFREAKTMPMNLVQKGKEIYLFWSIGRKLYIQLKVKQVLLPRVINELLTFSLMMVPVSGVELSPTKEYTYSPIPAF